MVKVPQSPNRLLASLSVADFEIFGSYLETIELVQQNVLFAAGGRLTRVFFPHSGVVSLVVSLASDDMVEVAMIGRDSCFGASPEIDDNSSFTDAVVQLPGFASTLTVERLRAAAVKSVALRRKLACHVWALFAQAQQSAACNVIHAIEARLARRLLRMHDLTGAVELPLTQEFLAQMMGVQSNSVSTVAHLFQRKGIIKYSRGKIEINDLEALKRASCECYKAVSAQYERLLDEI
jgi:CRP-like cAMP-binding protein